jgi:hypothetical protein
MTPILGILASGISGNLWQPGKDFDSIATATASSSPATLSLTSIPSTYRHLQIRIFGGGTGAYSPYMTFNTDTANNYSRHRLSGNSSTVTVSGNGTYGGISIGANAGMLYTTSGACSGAIIDILDYANTNKNKTTKSLTGWESTAVGIGYIDYESGSWSSTTAITRIDITMSTGTWANGSVVALYGVK